MSISGHTQRGDGVEISPGSGVIPILKEIADGQLKVVGTGFFCTRYGLFATARHVLDDLVDPEAKKLGTGFVFQHNPPHFFLRRIVGASLSNTSDVAIGQADNGVGGSGQTGPDNLLGPLSLTCPSRGEELVGYAYPENEILDFRDESDSPTLRGEYIRGQFRKVIESGPYIPYAHYETSLRILSGASGCPVFGSARRIVGIACRGWDFEGAEHEGDHLSSILPITQLLPITVGCARIPPDSWEYAQIPESRRGATLTFSELITYRHVDVGTF